MKITRNDFDWIEEYRKKYEPDPAPFMNMVNDYINLNTYRGVIHKAQRVFHEAFNRGKYSIARKVLEKYHLQDNYENSLLAYHKAMKNNHKNN